MTHTLRERKWQRKRINEYTKDRMEDRIIKIKILEKTEKIRREERNEKSKRSRMI